MSGAQTKQHAPGNIVHNNNIEYAMEDEYLIYF